MVLTTAFSEFNSSRWFYTISAPKVVQTYPEPIHFSSVLPPPPLYSLHHLTRLVLPLLQLALPLTVGFLPLQSVHHPVKAGSIEFPTVWQNHLDIRPTIFIFQRP